MFLLTLACVENQLKGPQQGVDEPLRELLVNPIGIDFGHVHLGAERTEIFTLESTGTSPVTLDGLELRGAESFDLTWPCV